MTWCEVKGVEEGGVPPAGGSKDSYSKRLKWFSVAPPRQAVAQFMRKIYIGATEFYLNNPTPIQGADHATLLGSIENTKP
jgi:hypothetical protein